jgi:asparagine synthase (glutamine-hydrolysing)
MCGITGIFSNRADNKVSIVGITDRIAHRGPDAHGYFVEKKIALGHRRLSIIDLDARANQPFTSQNGRYVVVFNGEIYNYKSLANELRLAGVTLVTSSDTEVLIEAFCIWGTGFVQKLNGMFAFAIYDKADEKLFLYRDRVGKKPLYYWKTESVFIFASEIKSILSHPYVRDHIVVNKATVSSFLQLGYIPHPNTFYENIYKFPAGHYGILTSDLTFSILPFWNVSHYLKTSHAINQDTAEQSLRDLLDEAVNSRLVADVPVGIFLSGGIDSSLVAAIAAKNTKLKTFSIGFKESKFDESAYAERIASHIGTDHHRYILSESDSVALVEKYLDHFDEPFADTSAIPTMLISQCARKDVKVALTGDGGDELFLGYGSYLWANRLANPIWSTLRPIIKLAMSSVPSSRWKRASNLFENVPEGKLRKHIFSQEQYFFSDHEVREILTDESYYDDWSYDDFRYLKVLTEAERQALFDFQFYLRDDLLVKVDRASMYYGLECRCPLLDHRLVEFAINLPEDLRLRNLESKFLLKRVLYSMIPEKLFDRPKWGFSIPLGQWLKNDLSYLMKYITPDQLDKTGVFDKAFVENLIHRFHNGEEYLYNRLWVIIIVQRFLIQNLR